MGHETEPKRTGKDRKAGVLAGPGTRRGAGPGTRRGAGPGTRPTVRKAQSNAPKVASPWVATAIAKLDDQTYSTKNRLAGLTSVVQEVLSATKGAGVILFSGGWIDAQANRPRTLVRRVESEAAKLLAHAHQGTVVCVGVDGRDGRDQLGVAVGRDGIVAIGRKFYPTEGEASKIDAAPEFCAREDGFARIFTVAGKRFYIGVCYDVFGVKKKNLPNPGTDAMLGLIHSFWPRGEGASGDVLYARHGFAGAAKQWRVPVFGAVKFRDRDVPADWPSGVVWNRGKASTMEWTYQDNPLAPARTVVTDVPCGRVVTRIFKM